MKYNLDDYLVLPSDNPNYKYELYDLDTALFVCYYKHRTREGKPLLKKSKSKKIQVIMEIIKP